MIYQLTIDNILTATSHGLAVVEPPHFLLWSLHYIANKSEGGTCQVQGVTLLVRLTTDEVRPGERKAVPEQKDNCEFV